MQHRSKAWLVVICLLVGGAFLMGAGFWRYRYNQNIRREYEQSGLDWRRRQAAGMSEEQARTLQNEILLANMQYVSVAQELYFADAGADGEARIINGTEADFNCRLTLIDDGTGMILYESGLIEPGQYIATLRLGEVLETGAHSCTAIWSFYTKNGEYAGDTAEKLVVIIKS